jgi:hypothetical protein
MGPDSALAKWSDLMFEASKVLQRPLNSSKSCKDYLASAGFTEVVETRYKWPQNRWPKDRKYKELGECKIRVGREGAETNRNVGTGEYLCGASGS